MYLTPTNIINIFTGQVVDESSLNVQDALEIGNDQMCKFESEWPSGFHSKLTKSVKTISHVSKAAQQQKSGPPDSDIELI